MKPAISIRNLSKCYKLGVINRQTLADEFRYWLSKIRRRDPIEHFTTIGHTPTEARRIEAENAGENDFWALKDVSFDVQPGEVVGIIGRNGAGKSTLLKLLTRITDPTSGEAIINGRIGSLLEVGTGFHPELTGRDNIYMNGTILGMKKHEVDKKLDEIVAFSEFEKFIETPVKRYSTGMLVRLAFAVAAHLDPEILIIDEVLAVGDAEFQKKCFGKMEDISKGGRTILFVSHNMIALNNLCDRGILIEKGKVIQDGTIHDVTSSYLLTTGIRGGKKSWSEESAPGSREVKLVEVALENKKGVVTDTFSVFEEIKLTIKYITYQKNLKFRCGAKFFTGGDVAFATMEPYEVIRINPGCYISKVQIPPHLLNEDEYRVSILIFPSIGTKQIKYGYVNEQELIVFQVYDPMTGDSARGDYYMRFAGALRPKLEWTMVKGLDFYELKKSSSND